jgi:Beta-lactamase
MAVEVIRMDAKGREDRLVPLRADCAAGAGSLATCVRKSIGRYEIGSAFRGSSALHAVGDSYLLLTRPSPQFNTVELRFQFRYAAPQPPRLLQLDSAPLWFSASGEPLKPVVVADRGIVGRIVERVSGHNLEEYFQEHIFRPLGMVETTFFPGPTMQSRIVKMANRQPDGTYKEVQIPVPKQIRPRGSGGLFSTAADYVRFMQMFLRGGQGVLRPEAIEAMRQNQIGALNVRRMISNQRSISGDFGFHIEAGDKFGLGFQLNPICYENGRGVNSMAWAGLWNTFFWIDPESNLCAVLLMQSAPFLTGRPSKRCRRSKRRYIGTGVDGRAPHW